MTNFLTRIINSMGGLHKEAEASISSAEPGDFGSTIGGVSSEPESSQDLPQKCWPNKSKPDSALKMGASRATKAKAKILKGPREDMESYPEAVDQLRSNVCFSNSNKSFKSSDGVLNHANGLLAKTSLKLEDEFKQLLNSDSVIAKDTLFSGETLNGGEFLENGPYKFIMQTDCNVVLYLNGNKVLWNTRTNGQGSGCRLVMQSDGNLVNYAGTRVIWASGTNRGEGNYRLTMQSDGNAVIYFGNAAIWATNTNSKTCPLVIAKDTLFSGETLNGGEFLENGPYKFIMQTDCNVVLYLNGNKVLWNTRTNGQGSGCRLVMQSDGNLVNYVGTRVIWASGTNHGEGNYRLTMQSDGNAVIYFGNAAIWATNTNS